MTKLGPRKAQLVAEKWRGQQFLERREIGLRKTGVFYHNTNRLGHLVGAGTAMQLAKPGLPEITQGLEAKQKMFYERFFDFDFLDRAVT